MIRSISLCAVALCLLVALPSCKKHDVNPDNGTTVNATIKANGIYSYDLGSFGDEEGASIANQALHFQVSSLQRSADFSKVIYTYQPAPNYTGTDEVVIRSERGSNGASLNDKIIVTTIRFTISN